MIVVDAVMVTVKHIKRMVNVDCRSILWFHIRRRNHEACNFFSLHFLSCGPEFSSFQMYMQTIKTELESLKTNLADKADETDNSEEHRAR